MTDRARAFLADLEGEAGLPPGALSDDLLQAFTAEDARLDAVAPSELEALAAAFLGSLRRAGFRRTPGPAPLDADAGAQVRQAIEGLGRDLAAGGVSGVSSATALLIQRICPYCPDPVVGDDGSGGAGSGGLSRPLPAAGGAGG